METIFGVVVDCSGQLDSSAVDSLLEVDYEGFYVIVSFSMGSNAQEAVNAAIKMQSSGITTNSIVHLQDDIPLVEYECFSKLAGASHFIRIKQDSKMSKNFLKVCEEQAKKGSLYIEDVDPTIAAVPFPIINRVYPLAGDYNSSLKEIKKLSLEKGQFFKNG